jgi:hypothetical protein
MHGLLLRAAPGISAAHHTSISDAMQSEGHFGNGGQIRAVADNTGERTLLSPMRAAAAAKDEEHVRLLQNVQRRCRRAGFDLDYQNDAVISPVALDAALKASGLDTTDRMALKSSLHALGMIA